MSRDMPWCYINDCHKRATLVIPDYPDEIRLCEDHDWLYTGVRRKPSEDES